MRHHTITRHTHSRYPPHYHPQQSSQIIDRVLQYLEGMLEMSQNYRRNQAIRREIRREELDNYFQERRRQLMQERAIEENSFMIIFKSNQERENFLQDCARELSGDPKAEWTHTIVRLRKTLTSFERDFESWFKKSVVCRLCMALDADLPSALTGNVLDLLTDMLYLADENSNIARKIMEYQPVQNVLTLAISPNRTLLERLRCTTFLSKLIYYQPSLRSQMVRDGAGSVLVEQVREVLVGTNGGLNMEDVSLVVEASSNFLGAHRTSGQLASNMNLVSTLLGPFMRLLMMEEIADQALIPLLQCMTRILGINKESIYVTVYFTLHFPQRLFSLMLNKEFKVRSRAIFMLANITYTDNDDITDDLMARGVVKQLEELLRLFPSSQGNIAKHIILALNNLMIAAQSNAEIICGSSICNYVIGQFTSSTSAEVQADAAYFINTAIHSLKYTSMQAFIARHDIIQLLAQILVDQKCYDIRIAKEVLEGLRLLVDRSNQVFHLGHNPIIHTMERLYNLSINAEHFRERIEKNKMLDGLTSALIQAIHDNYLENADAI